MSIIIAVIVGLVAVFLLLLPFFWGPGGLLQEASAQNNLDRLRAVQERILQRYLEDETAQRRGDVSAVAWNQRRAYLVSRYIDVTRRLDFLGTLAKQTAD